MNLTKPGRNYFTALVTLGTVLSLQMAFGAINQITNADFSAGNIGFTNGYVFTTVNLGGGGEYTVTANPQNWNASLQSPPTWVDHSPTADNLSLLVNGSPISGRDCWRQSIPVSPNTTYNVSAWATDSYPGVGGEQAQLRFYVNGSGIGSPFTVTDQVGTPIWQQFSAQFNSGGASNITLSLRDLSTAWEGNDVAIDDLVLEVGTNSPPVATNCTPPASGLIGWWPGQGNANDVIGGRNGVLYNGTTFGAGEVGQAFSFDGVNDSIINAVGGIKSVTNSFTMEFWAWPTGGRDSTPETYQGIYGTGGQRYAIYPDFGDLGPVGAGVSVGTNGISVFEHGYAYLSSLLVYDAPITGWTHIAVVYVNRQPRLYVNGSLVRTGLVSTRVPYPSTYFGEAGPNTGNYGFYRGLLDEVSIYNRSLSASEVLAVYNANTLGKCATNPPPVTSCVLPISASVTNPANGHVYLLLAPTNWNCAESSAVASGGHLVTINDAAENLWVYNTFASFGGLARPLWIGLNDQAMEGTWVWTSGDLSAYRQWAPGEPNSGGGVYPDEDVGIMRGPDLGSPGSWNDAPEYQIAAGVVEINGSLPPVSPTCTPVPTGIVSWWRAEANALDSVDGNHGTFAGNVTYGAGRVGTAFVLDGDRDGVRVGTGTNLQLQNFTIEAWIKRSSATLASFNGNGNGELFVVGTNPGAYGLRIEQANNQLVLGKSGGDQVTSAASITDTNWHHVAVTKQGTAVVFFVDGVAYAAPAYNPGPFTFSAPAYIGAWFNNFGQVDNSFYGSIDEMTVYNHGLTAAEILAIYTAGTVGKCTPGITNPPPASGCYSAAGDFSTNSNPNGLWSYGFSTALGGALILNPELGNDLNLVYWRSNISFGTPAVIYNPRATTQTNGTGTIVLAPGQLAFHPGQAGQFGLIRFSPPSNGVYRVSGNFYGADIHPTTTDVHILKNGNVLFNGLVNGFGPGTGPAFDTNVSLAIGDRLEFAVGRGANNEFSFDSTGIAANLCLITNLPPGVTNPPPATCAAPPSGIVSWWRAEDNALDSADGNNGTFEGNVTYGTGRVGRAFVLDGNRDGVRVGTGTNLQLQNFTIEAWIKRSSATLASFNGNGNGELFVVGTNPGAYGLRIEQANNQLVLGKSGGDQVTSAASITDTNWHHVAVTKQGTVVAFFVDGVAYAAPAYNPGPFTFSAPAYIGAWFNNFGQVDNSFYGSIDEMTVYNRGLTSAEILAIYTAGTVGKCVTVVTNPPVATNCVASPSGLISWWRSENNANDSADGNHGLGLNGVTYGAGSVGQAFNFDGVNDMVVISNRPNLNPTGSFSIEGWVYPRQDRAQIIMAKWGDDGVFANNRSYALHTSTSGRGLNFAISDYDHQWDGAFHLFQVDGVLALNAWNHVAATYDQAAGIRRLYVNGVQVGQRTNAPVPVYASIAPVTIGVHLRSPDWLVGHMDGLIDELSLYSRMLTTAEIAALFNAGGSGKCRTQPIVVTSPASQKVTVGSNVTFSVVAEGTPQLQYQWRRNTTNLAGATGASHTFVVAPNSGGQYSVRVTNWFGSVFSSNALLTVNFIPVANPQSVNVSEDSSVNLTLTGSDTNGDSLAYSIVTPPAHGLLTGSGANRTYTPATNYFGPDSFSFKVNDGLVDSALATVSINVLNVNDVPVAQSQSVATEEDTALAITLGASDADGDTLNYSLTSSAHGSWSGTAPNLTYTPNTNFHGSDSFTFTVADGVSTSAVATVSITVRSANDAPIARIEVSPLTQVLGITNKVVIAAVCGDGTVILDGSSSSDVENDPLTYAWTEGTNSLGSAAMVTNQFAIGTHEVTLTVNDGALDGVANEVVEVVSPAQGLGIIIAYIEDSGLGRANGRPLIVSLKNAAAAFDRCDLIAAVSQLEAFQNKVRAQVAPLDAELADKLIAAAQQIIDAVQAEP